MEFLPVFLAIRDRRCVIVGGGEVARRKASLLIRAGACVHVIAEQLDQSLTLLLQEQGGSYEQAPFEEQRLDGAALVVAATADRALNKAVSEAARARNIPVNVVDQPELCSFILPAIVDRSPVVVAISSGATSPVLTRHLKELNETMLPAGIDRLARFLGDRRERVKQAIAGFSERLRFWERVLDGAIPELIYAGQEQAASARFEELLAASAASGTGNQARRGGEVYLVGAGPGDPDLLTLRALRLMHKADVVLYDRLVSPQIMQRLRPDAEKIHVGKEQARHSVSQETINQMLVRLAGEGKRVLRLKGGDPFIFGRGGEELETLARAGVPFQVVPGITAASGCAAYAGIPLTHRDYAHSVRFLTGHLKGDSLDLAWDSLVGEQQTLVFYMGLMGLEAICRELVRHGMDPAMPIAIVQQGTTDNQRVLCSDLANMPALAAATEIRAPTIIIVGEVVKLRENLAWFDGNPAQDSPG